MLLGSNDEEVFMVPCRWSHTGWKMVKANAIKRDLSLPNLTSSKTLKIDGEMGHGTKTNFLPQDSMKLQESPEKQQLASSRTNKKNNGCFSIFGENLVAKKLDMNSSQDKLEKEQIMNGTSEGFAASTQKYSSANKALEN